MNRLSRERRSHVLRALVEGNSIRATCRITGAAKGTVLTLLADAGAVCLDYQDTALRNLTCRRLQCDEIWSFCHAKEKNVPDEHQGEFGYGDVWTWTAIDPDTKLVPSFAVGTRNADAANALPPPPRHPCLPRDQNGTLRHLAGGYRHPGDGLSGEHPAPHHALEHQHGTRPELS